MSWEGVGIGFLARRYDSKLHIPHPAGCKFLPECKSLPAPTKDRHNHLNAREKAFNSRLGGRRIDRSRPGAECYNRGECVKCPIWIASQDGKQEWLLHMSQVVGLICMIPSFSSWDTAQIPGCMRLRHPIHRLSQPTSTALTKPVAHRDPVRGMISSVTRFPKKRSVYRYCH